MSNGESSGSEKFAGLTESKIEEEQESEVKVEIVKEVTPELVEGVKKLVPELGSVNQVKITEEYLTELIESKSSHLLVARNPEKQIEGMAVLVVYPCLVNYRGLIETLVVDPSARKKGVASAIIKQALQEADKLDVNNVRVCTYKTNIPANNLLKKSGGVFNEEEGWYDFELKRGPRR